MTRIIAGEAGGRTIKVPPSATRPTSDRVREALFSVLEALFGGPLGWRGKAVLDLYAGSGALALEALSRGAASAVAVDSASAATRVIRANAAVLGLGDQLRVVTAPVEALVARPPPGGRPFDLVFADPPYDLPTARVEAVLGKMAVPPGRAPPGQSAQASGSTPSRDPYDSSAWPGSLDDAAGPAWLAAGAVVVVERSTRSPAVAWPSGWEDIGVRKYGETALHLARADGQNRGLPPDAGADLGGNAAVGGKTGGRHRAPGAGSGSEPGRQTRKESG
ncbi:MAG: RsmD family RNA methyltransferase [Bifidobacteriaceae bacterium]|jgi:16S rRNA (guanine966-N2)-methyltransferase|nr:RsmD family RNA methyltransferase [Bifidobacteriaceae bacterium]